MPRTPGKPPRGQRDMSLPVQEWRLEVGAPDHGARLDAFLGRGLRWRSRSRLQRAIAEGRVEVLSFKDPQRAPIGRPRPGLRLRAGQEVVVRLPAPQAEAEGMGDPGSGPEIPVLFEDEHLLAVGKPPHLSVYPTRRHRVGSLIERVHQRERTLRGDVSYPPTLCHRLDRETSGLVLFARSREARAAVNAQFEQRRVEKVYLAVVEGELEGSQGRIELPIGPDAGSRVEIKMGVRRSGDGLAAATAWRVRQRLRGRTLVELRPETGRQHQLRVHLAAIGHPLVGDKLYLGGDEVFLRSLAEDLIESDLGRLGHDRQALHAWRLTIEHPASGEPLRLAAALWPDLQALLALAGADRPTEP